MTIKHMKREGKRDLAKKIIRRTAPTSPYWVGFSSQGVSSGIIYNASQKIESPLCGFLPLLLTVFLLSLLLNT